MFKSTVSTVNWLKCSFCLLLTRVRGGRPGQGREGEDGVGRGTARVAGGAAGGAAGVAGCEGGGAAALTGVRLPLPGGRPLFLGGGCTTTGASSAFLLLVTSALLAGIGALGAGFLGCSFLFSSFSVPEV